MKLFFITLFLLSSLSVFAQSEVTLDPGSSALVNAGEQIRVSCSGSVVSGGPDCTITQEGSHDKFGKFCAPFSGYCAFFYRFGTFIEQRLDKSKISLASWCASKVGQN